MKWTGLNELREKFLEFFESKGCLRLPSFSLVPKDDNSLLLINSGMAPMKKYFTGEVTPPRKRVTTCQKCIRTPDIERVGITARHGTFFEMLGNFSFGDYFKHEATAWAWEFFTKVLEMPPEKLYVSIYEDDDEAFDIWTKEVGVDPSHMARKITSGNTVQVLAVLVRKFTLTVVTKRAAADQTVMWAVNVTVLLRFGTLYLLSLRMTARVTTLLLNIRTLIQVWDLKDLPVLCRVLTTFSSLTQFRTL